MGTIYLWQFIGLYYLYLIFLYISRSQTCCTTSYILNIVFFLCMKFFIQSFSIRNIFWLIYWSWKNFFIISYRTLKNYRLFCLWFILRHNLFNHTWNHLLGFLRTIILFKHRIISANTWKGKFIKCIHFLLTHRRIKLWR